MAVLTYENEFIVIGEDNNGAHLGTVNPIPDPLPAFDKHAVTEKRDTSSLEYDSSLEVGSGVFLSQLMKRNSQEF